jgi:hypothetical protein
MSNLRLFFSLADHMCNQRPDPYSEYKVRLRRQESTENNSDFLLNTLDLCLNSPGTRSDGIYRKHAELISRYLPSQMTIC